MCEGVDVRVQCTCMHAGYSVLRLIKLITNSAFVLGFLIKACHRLSQVRTTEARKERSLHLNVTVHWVRGSKRLVFSHTDNQNVKVLTAITEELK